MKMLPKLLNVTALAASLLFVMSAEAAITTIPLPDSAYTSSTTLLPITAVDFSTTSTLSDSNLTVAFSSTMTAFTAGSSWTTWGAPPNAETSTPRVLAPDVGVAVVTLTFSQALSIFGLEAQPDAISDYGPFPLSLDFYNNATLLGTVNGTLDGTTSQLFAASSATPITKVVLTVGGNVNVPSGVDPGIAQLRYALVVPEPATLFTCAGMLALLVGFRRMRPAKN